MRKLLDQVEKAQQQVATERAWSQVFHKAVQDTKDCLLMVTALNQLMERIGENPHDVEMREQYNGGVKMAQMLYGTGGIKGLNAQKDHAYEKLNRCLLERKQMMETVVKVFGESQYPLETKGLDISEATDSNRELWAILYEGLRRQLRREMEKIQEEKITRIDHRAGALVDIAAIAPAPVPVVSVHP
jgi:hypothetical protein